MSGILLSCAEAVWAEYFADRRAHPTYPGGEPMHAKMFAEQIPAVEAKVKDAIRQFRRHADVSRLLQEVMPEIGFLFSLAGYVMGAVAGAALPLENLSPEAARALAGSCFEPAWQALAVELDRMYQAHGNWPGIEAYAPVEQIVRSFMARLGMHFSDRGGQPYLDVPFTVDTMG